MTNMTNIASNVSASPAGISLPLRDRISDVNARLTSARAGLDALLNEYLDVPAETFSRRISCAQDTLASELNGVISKIFVAQEALFDIAANSGAPEKSGADDGEPLDLSDEL